MKPRIFVLAVLLGLLYLPARTQSLSGKQTPATEAVAQSSESDDQDVSMVESIETDAEVVQMPIQYAMTAGGVASSGRVLLTAVDKAFEASFLSQAEADESELIQTPRVFHLDQNYPNPFNPTTVIRFALPVSGIVTLKVFNLLGQEVATLLDRELTAGYQDVTWAASKMSSGVYFYRLQVYDSDESKTRRAGSFIETKKLLLMK